MRRVSMGLAIAALPLVMGMSIAMAETTTCGNADANNQRVKETCKGTVQQLWDDNKCMWYKCVETTTTTDPCAEAKAQNAVIEKSCLAEGKRVVASIDQNQCKRLRCEEGTMPTNGKCAESDKRNEAVKQSCTSINLRQKYDANDCMILWCESSNSSTPSTTEKNYCTELKIKLATLKDGSADYKYVYALWNKSCNPMSEEVQGNISECITDNKGNCVNPNSECMEMQKKLAAMNSSNPDYRRLKEMVAKRCGQGSTGITMTDSSSTQCTLTGCWLKCENGKAMNVCQCGGQDGGMVKPPVSSASSSSSSKICRPVKDPKTGKVTKVCK